MSSSTKTSLSPRLWKTALLVVVALAAIGTVAVGFVRRNNAARDDSADKGMGGQESSRPQEEAVESILPDLQVDILREEEQLVQGTLTVRQGGEEFVFYSQHTDETTDIGFLCDKQMAMATDEMDGWCGFKWIATSGESINVFLSRYDGEEETSISISPDHELDDDSIKAMESFISSRLGEYFVGLSFKLGAMGKYGTTSLAYEQLHFQARWIFDVAVKDENISTSLHWDLPGSHADESHPHGRRGLHESSVVDDINRLVVGYSSHEDGAAADTKTPPTSASLPPWLDMHDSRNLGNCQLAEQCGNPAYGRCGPGSTCWSWVCGDCGCWLGCRDHDYYCSCVSRFDFWCINVFWVRCSG